MATPCELLTTQLGLLFSCSPLEQFTRIQTPFLYPDGDIIDLFYKEENGSITLTDLGETGRWLRMQTTTQRRSVRQRQLIGDICLNHGIEFYRGMLLVRLKLSDDLAPAIIRLSQGALRVADLWFTFRTKAGESISDEVEEVFRERGIPFERNSRLQGRSARVWELDFYTRNPQHSSLVSVLSTGSRSAAHELVARTSAQWHDLSNLKIGPEARQFITLFDDTLDVWSIEDFRLVSDISEVAYWSRPDEFLEKIAA